jgi:hypothetical protein
VIEISLSIMPGGRYGEIAPRGCELCELTLWSGPARVCRGLASSTASSPHP